MYISSGSKLIRQIFTKLGPNYIIMELLDIYFDLGMLWKSCWDAKGAVNQVSLVTSHIPISVVNRIKWAIKH